MLRMSHALYEEALKQADGQIQANEALRTDGKANADRTLPCLERREASLEAYLPGF